MSNACSASPHTDDAGRANDQAVTAVRQYLEEQYGPTALYRGGFTVETTLDMRLQQLAEQTLKQGLVALDKRYGIYEGPMRHLEFTGDATTNAQLVAEATMRFWGEILK